MDASPLEDIVVRNAQTAAFGPSTASLVTGYSGIVGSVFSSISSALSASSAATAQKQAYAYQAAVAKNNQIIAGMKASMAITQGQTLEGESRLANAQVYSTQRATMAANGVDITEGSSINVLATTKYVGNVDAATIHDNALRAAWGYQVEGVNAGSTASFNTAASDNINPTLAAGTALMGTAGSVADKWYAARQNGMI